MNSRKGSISFLECHGLAHLQFSRNPEIGSESDWMTGLRGSLVFSNREFDKAVAESNDLRFFLEGGNHVWVMVSELPSGHYAAALLPEQQDFKRPLVPDQSTVVFIDAHNMFHSLEGMHAIDRVADVVEAIVEKYKVFKAYFYVCLQTARQYSCLTEKDLSRLRKIPNLIIIDREPKIVSDHGEQVGRKTDIDHLVIRGIVDAYHKYPGLTRIVLIGGDSDYANALDLWVNGPGGPKIVEVISTRAAAAQEMFNHRVIPLSEFVPKKKVAVMAS